MPFCNQQFFNKYPSLSPYAYCANNPVILVDPDGRKIRAINAAANKCISAKDESITGRLAGSYYNGKSGLWETGSTFKDYNEFYSHAQNISNKESLFLSDKDIKESYNFYLALQNENVFEVEILFTHVDSETYWPGQEGSRVAGQGKQTSNSEDKKFTSELMLRGKLDEELSSALFYGTTYKSTDTHYSNREMRISPNARGGEWAYFRNSYYPKDSKIKGLIKVHGTNNNDINFSIIIDALNEK
jgi:hypothetical protein